MYTFYFWSSGLKYTLVWGWEVWQASWVGGPLFHFNGMTQYCFYNSIFHVLFPS